MNPIYSKDGITLYCGKCEEVLPGLGRYDLLLTDPPYGMDYDTNGNRFTLGGRALRPVEGDKEPFDPRPWLSFEKVILWGFNHFPTHLPAGGSLVWIKRTEAAFGKFLSDAEIAWMNFGKGVYAYSDTKHAIACKRIHPTQKPVGLMSWCIKQAGPTVRTILDPYAGVGTTGVAAKLAGLKCTLIEQDAEYCEKIITRLRQGVLSFSENA